MSIEVVEEDNEIIIRYEEGFDLEIMRIDTEKWTMERTNELYLDQEESADFLRIMAKLQQERIMSIIAEQVTKAMYNPFETESEEE